MHRVSQAIASIALFLSAATASAQGYIEGPALVGGFPSVESGIGLVYGWHCSSKNIEIQFDGGPRLRAGAGTPRADTAGVCGRSDTGFGLTVNYNDLAPGPHTVVAYADGVEFSRVRFDTVSLGSSYITGLFGGIALDFPIKGQSTVFVWQEHTQSFGISHTLPNPLPLLDKQGAFTGFARVSPLSERLPCVGNDRPGYRGPDTESSVNLDIHVDSSTEVATIALNFPDGRTCTVRGKISQAFAGHTYFQGGNTNCLPDAVQGYSVNITHSSQSSDVVTLDVLGSLPDGLSICGGRRQYMTVMAWRRRS